jgi:two-component sensor histidine kinase/CHASE3 domain sensor protein
MSLSGRFVVQSTIGLLAVGFLTLLGIVGMTSWLNERAQHSFNEVIEARNTRTAATELRNALHTAESSQRGYIATGNDIYLAPYDSAKAQVLRQLEILKRVLRQDTGSGTLLERLNATVSGKITEMDQTIGLKKGGKSEEAYEILNTNRGKALTDEANVYLSGITRRADERLTFGVDEQRVNTAMLRWVSIIGALVIVLVVAGVGITILRYTREIAHARDEVRSLAASLEERVRSRTADLARARDRAEVLVAEVNHRVANSLAMVASLVRLQGRGVSDKASKEALEQTEARIYAISSVHKRLYSSGDVRFVELDEYLAAILDHLATSMRDEGNKAQLHHDLEPLKLQTDASINLGVVVTELVTNAFKYAYPDRTGEVRVRLRSLADRRAELIVEDDGVGRGEEVKARGTGLGTRIVSAMAASMQGEIEYMGRAPGTAARLVFPLDAQERLQ